MTTSEPDYSSNIRKLGDSATTRQLPKVQRLLQSPAAGGTGQGVAVTGELHVSQIRHVSVLFDHWIKILAAAALIALATMGVAATFAPTYSASTSISVRFPSQAGNQMDAAAAANTVASQIAVLANSAPVVLATAKALNIAPGGLGSQISAVESGATNLIAVTATGADRAAAAKTVVEAATALRNFASNSYILKATGGVAPSKMNPTKMKEILATLPSFTLLDSNPVGGSSQLSLTTVGFLGFVVGFFLAWEALYVFLNGKRSYEAEKRSTRREKE